MRKVTHAYAREAQQQFNIVSIELVSSLNGAFCRIVFARACVRAGRVMYEASRAISLAY